MPTPLTWPNCHNSRDLGGLIRSDNLDQLTPKGHAAFAAVGISRIIDLRDVWETEAFPSPYRADPRWLNIPLNDPADPAIDSDDLLVQYRTLIDNYPHRFATALTAIAEAPPGPVLVACHAGRDRTGLVTALTLAAIDVPAEAIAADYATAPPQFPAEAATMRALLTHVDLNHGGVVAYLRAAGLTPNHLAALKNRLSAVPAHQPPPAADAH
ncbi:tyrosine-protein phosphatase [Kribbella sp. NPDC056951]|uniref:tyrosine-protein phosphatase n=1 Tax=Kribbella sp. NPDC056951 TaxID=3345978 RepID=UPI0036252F54